MVSFWRKRHPNNVRQRRAGQAICKSIWYLTVETNCWRVHMQSKTSAVKATDETDGSTRTLREVTWMRRVQGWGRCRRFIGTMIRIGNRSERRCRKWKTEIGNQFSKCIALQNVWYWPTTPLRATAYSFWPGIAQLRSWELLHRGLKDCRPLSLFGTSNMDAMNFSFVNTSVQMEWPDFFFFPFFGGEDR